MSTSLLQQLKKIGLIPLLLTACLTIGALTYWQPAIRVIVSPIGNIAWSAHDIVKVIPKGIFEPSRKSDFKIHDFIDLISKISPKDSAENPTKISYTFIYLMFVPVALAISYFGIFLQLILLFFGKARLLQKAAGVTALFSLYALLGTFYLGRDNSIG